MTRLATLVAVCAVLVSIPAPALAQCGLFSTNVKCSGAPRGLPSVTFDRQAPDLASLVKAPARPAGLDVMRAVPVGQQAPPIDCAMVKKMDGNIDPQLARRPPAGIHFTMPVVQMPSCLAK